jgi:hypothetical protein
MLREQHDLSDMRGVVGHLAVDGFKDRVCFAAYSYGLRQILGRERANRRKDAIPAILPPGRD